MDLYWCVAYHGQGRVSVLTIKSIYRTGEATIFYLFGYIRLCFPHTPKPSPPPTSRPHLDLYLDSDLDPVLEGAET